MKYKCSETFSLPECDDGVETEREVDVLKGSIWESEEDIEDNDTEVELAHESGAWLEISRELFDLMFEEAEA